MKINVTRLLLRILCLGFMLGRVKKKEIRRGRSRWFVDVVFPKPAGCWKEGNDFLFEPQKPISRKIKAEDWVVFFGYKAPSGWKAKWVFKIFGRKKEN